MNFTLLQEKLNQGTPSLAKIENKVEAGCFKHTHSTAIRKCGYFTQNAE